MDGKVAIQVDAAIGGLSVEHRAGLLAWHAYGSTWSILVTLVAVLGAVIWAALVFAYADFENNLLR